MTSCPFCDVDPKRVFAESEVYVCIWDAFPVSKGHALVVPRRHFSNWFDASIEEQTELLGGIRQARQQINSQFSPNGFNVGINIGAAAGQTVPHMHIHVIPRYEGDIADPRGGVRHVIPGKGNYLVGSDSELDQSQVFGSIRPVIEGLSSDLAMATRVDVAVAFVTRSGLAQLEPYILDLLDRGGHVRILTGDYLDVSEPAALKVLHDWSLEYPAQVEACVFETTAATGFHPKAYLLHRGAESAVAYIGSSNATKHGLTSGIEWNQRFDISTTDSQFQSIGAELDTLFSHPNVRQLSSEWIEAYSRRRRYGPTSEMGAAIDLEEEHPEPPPTPTMVQQEGLAALHETRQQGNRAGLVVMATGLGKTWLSAFDSVSFGRVLFVAHREEILNQALRTYRRIRPEARFGVYMGGRYDHDADALFASIQTLGRQNHLDRFSPTAFDYVVVDEFHHASATTYRRLIDYFSPEFLLGLTATPERTDGGDLLSLCGENLVFRADLVDGINRGLLAPFQYFGVPDLIDFSNIPWRSGRFDPESLEHAVATEARASNAFEQWENKAQKRTLAFCVSKRHADFMADYFVNRGVNAVAVHSGTTAAPRTQALEQLTAGQIDIVFAVDMFNEGVDVPAIDTVMMLRPTESKILWLQQLGRGLRKAADKTHLAVIDYIGNHRSFLQVPAVLFPGIGSTPGEIHRALMRLERGELELPQSCAIRYDLEAISILKQLSQPSTRAEQVTDWYITFKELHDRRPSASEAFHEGYGPQAVSGSFGSWFSMVSSEGDLTPQQDQAFSENRAFVEALETTRMNKNFKMLVLQAMLAEGAFPGEIHIDRLIERVRKAGSRVRALVDDFEGKLEDDKALRELLENNPIDAWIGRRSTGGTAYFGYSDSVFRTINLEPGAGVGLAELTRELVDYRLARYLDRTGQQSDEPLIVPSNDKPVLWHEYMREDIPGLWGLEFIQTKWRQGFVREGSHMFLLVSLEKQGMAIEHQYADKFLSPSLFQWASQNRTKRSSGVGQAIKNHEKDGTDVHLFIRDKRKTPQGKAAPLIYCGEVAFVDWEGDQPISIRWKLDNPISGNLLKRFRVPA